MLPAFPREAAPLLNEIEPELDAAAVPVDTSILPLDASSPNALAVVIWT